MTNNKQQTAVEWLVEQFYDNEGMLTTKKLMKAIEMEKEQRETDYQDGKDFAIINECAEQSTLDASSYAEGYKEGYNRALQYMIDSIRIKLKPNKENNDK